MSNSPNEHKKLNNMLITSPLKHTNCTIDITTTNKITITSLIHDNSHVRKCVNNINTKINNDNDNNLDNEEFPSLKNSHYNYPIIHSSYTQILKLSLRNHKSDTPPPKKLQTKLHTTIKHP